MYLHLSCVCGGWHNLRWSLDGWRGFIISLLYCVCVYLFSCIHVILSLHLYLSCFSVEDAYSLPLLFLVIPGSEFLRRKLYSSCHSSIFHSKIFMYYLKYPASLYCLNIRSSLFVVCMYGCVYVQGRCCSYNLNACVSRNGKASNKTRKLLNICLYMYLYLQCFKTASLKTYSKTVKVKSIWIKDIEKDMQMNCVEESGSVKCGPDHEDQVIINKRHQASY